MAEYNKAPIPGVRVNFEDYDENEIELADIEAAEQGQGAGTAAMTRIIELADWFGVNIMLVPAGDNTSSEKYQRLHEFYSRFGFYGEDAMHREGVEDPNQL